MINPLFPLVLIPALIPVFLGGRVLVARATGDRSLTRLLAPGMSLALWLLAVHVSGLLFHSFYVGLFVGTLLAAGVGLVIRLPPEDELEPGLPLGWGALAAFVLAVVLLSAMQLHYFLWDELLTVGHLSMPLQMLNGIYPPRHLTFPVFELRYHYGFDLLNACVAALLAQPRMPLVLHVDTLVLFGYTALLAWGLGQRLIAPGAGPLTAASLLLGGGFTFFCGPYKPFFKYIEGLCSTYGLRQVPPMPSNFLQHPWTLGLPIALTALIIFQTRRTRSGWWWLSLTLLLMMLSLSQIVLFAGTLGGMMVAGALTSPPPRWRPVLAFAGWGAVVLLLARELHGFFAPTVEPEGLKLEFHPFWKNSVPQFGTYLLVSLGFLMLFGSLGFLFLKRERLFLAILGVFGLVVFALFRYPSSWDIVKFLMLVQIALAISGAAVLWAAWQVPRLRWLSVLGLVSVIAYGTGWLLTGLAHGYDGWYSTKPEELALPADKEMIAYLRRHIRAGELVFRRDSPAGYAIQGGLPIQNADFAVNSFGFSQQLHDARTELIYKPHPDVEEYKRQGITWFVFGEWDGHMRTQMDEWLKDGKADHVLSVPPLDLYHLR